MPEVQHTNETPGTILTWLIAHPILDRMLTKLLSRPWLLIGIAGVIGLLLCAAGLIPALQTEAGTFHQTQSTIAREAVNQPLSQPLAHELSEENAVFMVVIAYNQASITAAQTGRVDALAPYLAADGSAWQQAQAEYLRRAQQGETSTASLVRWGVLHKSVSGDTAQIETQEQWDVLTRTATAIISSRRGVLTRNLYTLRRSPEVPGGWLIVTVETTTLVA